MSRMLRRFRSLFIGICLTVWGGAVLPNVGSAFGASCGSYYSGGGFTVTTTTSSSTSGTHISGANSSDCGSVTPTIYVVTLSGSNISTIKFWYYSCNSCPSGWTRTAHDGETITGVCNYTYYTCTAPTVTCSAGYYLDSSGSCKKCSGSQLLGGRLRGYYCPGGTYTSNGSIQGRYLCPENYPNAAMSGTSAITECYSDTKSRPWSGGQNSCSCPSNSTCSCNSCSGSACDYVAYSNSDGTGDGTIKSGCSSNSANCNQTLYSFTCNAGYANNGSGGCYACSDHNYTETGYDTESITGGTRTRAKYRTVYHSSSAGGSCGVSSYGDWYGHTSWTPSCSAGYEAYGEGCRACSDYNWTDYGSDFEYITCGSRSRSKARTAQYTSSAGGSCYHASYSDWWWWGDWTPSCDAGCANNGSGACYYCSDHNWTETGSDTESITGGSRTRSKYRTVYYSSSAGGSCAFSSYGDWYGHTSWTPSCNAGYEASGEACKACSDYNWTETGSDFEYITGGSRTRSKYRTVYYSSSAGGSCGVSSYGDWYGHTSWTPSCSAGYEAYGESCRACSDYNWTDYGSDAENVTGGSRSRSKARTAQYTSSAGGSCYHASYSDWWWWGDWSYSCGAEYYYAGGDACSWVGNGYYSPSGDNSRYECTNKPSNTHYTGSSSGNSCAWECDAGYYGSSAAGYSSCEACGNQYYCTGGTNRDYCGYYINYGGTSPDSVEMWTLSNGSWSDYTHATSVWDCLCNFWFHDDSTSQYFYQTSCYGGPSGNPYRHYDWCRTGYYATDPLGWNEWYVSCTACTNKPANSYYTSYSTPSAMYEVENNCPWNCNAGYEKSGSSCKACSDYNYTQTSTDSKSVTGGSCSRSMSRPVYHSSSAGGSCGVSSYGDWSYGSWSCSCTSAGYYYVGGGADYCSTAPAGYYSPANDNSLYACYGRGYYSTGGASGCSGVDAGYYTTGCNSSGDVCSGETACGGNEYYCSGGIRYGADSGYYSTGGSSTTHTGQTQCEPGYYCTGGVRYDCPSATANARTTFPESYYSPTIDSTGIVSGYGLSAATSCYVLTWMTGTRGSLYEYVYYNASSGKYDGSLIDYGWGAVKPGYYLTTKGGCGSYAYYKDANVCPEGYYCPGKTYTVCDGSNQSTVHTTNYGLESCPSGYTSGSGASAIGNCYITVTAGHYIGTSGQNSSNWGTCSTGSHSSQHTVYYGNTSSCECDTGYYDNSGICTLCPAGYYMSGSTCVPCTGATYSTGGALSCTSCPTGYTYNTSATKGAASQCQIHCDAGTYIAGDYTKLEYIESTGTQWINTEIRQFCNSDLEIEFSFKPTQLGGFMLGNAYTQTNIDTGNGFSVGTTGITKVTYSGTLERIYYNDVLKTTLGWESCVYDNLPIALFTLGFYTDSPYVEYWYHTYGVMYYAKIYDNGVLVRNFIPARRNSDNAVGMLDLVTGGFFTNSGSGAFVAGPDVGAIGGTTCTAVGTGYYAPATTIGYGSVAPRTACSNKPANATYTGSGTNNDCPWVCNAGYYKNGNSCSPCTGATYSNAGATSCTPCPTGYTANTTSGKTSASQCQIHCDAGTYIAGDYTKLEYIESTGTQWINPGFRQKYQQPVTLEFSFRPTALVGWMGGNAYTQIQISSDNGFSIGTNGISKVVYDGLDEKIYYNNTLKATRTWDSSNWDNLPILLFTLGHHTSSPYISEGHEIQGAMYYAKIWNDDGTLVRDFIPVRRNSDGVIGMLDLISGNFLTNGGTGTFTAGSDNGTIGTACTNVGAGYYAAASTVNFGSTGSRTACSNAPSNSSYTGSATTNSCPWACDSGYALTSNNTCEQLCTAGVTGLHTSTGLVFNLYANRQTQPSIYIQPDNSNTVCYVNLAPGAANNAVNVDYNGAVYHSID